MDSGNTVVEILTEKEGIILATIETSIDEDNKWVRIGIDCYQPDGPLVLPMTKKETRQVINALKNSLKALRQPKK